MESTRVYLASLATFKSFYDKDMDVYSIISEFIKDTLYKSREPLELENVKESLYVNYRFIIPISVIKTALSKLVKSSNVNKLDGKKYSLISVDDIKRFSEIEQSNNDFTNVHQKIIESIVSFIKMKDPSCDIVKDELVDNFFKYITFPYEDTKYKKYIAMFLAIDTNHEVKSLIQQIKDGEILLTGLSYQQDPNEIEIYKLRRDLTIYRSGIIV